MTRSLPVLVGVLGLACCLSGCSGGADTHDSAASPRDTATASPSTSTSSSTPTARRYTAKELAAALPSTPAELHHVKQRTACRDATKECSTGSKGFAYVDASNHGQNSIDLVVSIAVKAGAATMASAEKSCPQGKLDTPLTWLDKAHKHYQPGQRGTSRRTPWTTGTWSGYVCEQHLVRLFPNNETSERTTEVRVFLGNGHHQLLTLTHSVPTSKALATEYLRRLEKPFG